jgi:enoyl-CoA hydratase/carnithine racemase
MALQFSTVTRKGPITIVTLSRPEVYNALHTDAHNELHEVFNDFASDPGTVGGDRHRRRRQSVLRW